MLVYIVSMLCQSIFLKLYVLVPFKNTYFKSWISQRQLLQVDLTEYYKPVCVCVCVCRVSRVSRVCVNQIENSAASSRNAYVVYAARALGFSGDANSGRIDIV